MSKAPTILTIAGSDSGGGAGIQADVKTIASLGLHPACAITSVTAQNTTGVLSAYDIPCEVIRDQIDAVCKDMDIRWAKSGMLSSAEIISTVAEMVKKYDLKLVADPVMAAEAGGDLLRKDAVDTLKKELLPITEVVTPNINEACILSGMKIYDLEDAKQAAKIIGRSGVEVVIITGGHLEGSDLIYDSRDNTYKLISGSFVKGGTHGSGCTYSASLAATLARGYNIDEAAKIAKDFVVEAIKGSVQIGKGVGPVNQLSRLLNNANRYNTVQNVKSGVEILNKCMDFAGLIPEVGSNIAMALPDARSISEIAAISGRMINVKDSPKAVGDIEFGTSEHVGRIVLAAMEYDPDFRASMNIRYSEDILNICKEIGFSISSFSREEEPESMSGIDWGTKQAIKDHGDISRIIYDTGGMGKEAMIRIMGHNAEEVAHIALEIADKYAILKNRD